MRGWLCRAAAGPGRGVARRGPRSSAPSRPGRRAEWCAVGTSGFSFAGPGRARLVPAEVTSVAVPLPGDRHVVPEPAVEVEVVAPGLAGSSVADVGVERMPVVGELLRAVGSPDRADPARHA